MKRLQRSDDQFTFEFSDQEQFVLLALLEMFPMVPVTHHRLSREPQAIPDPEDNQHLLEDSLSAHQSETQDWIASLADGNDRFTQSGESLRLSVTRMEMERLLQILNDVRVGSWLALGSPELEPDVELKTDEENAMYVHWMELAGWFESFFLDALHGPAADMIPPSAGDPAGPA